jgi:alpha-tubulin suppressor-like RCC1 family protein
VSSGKGVAAAKRRVRRLFGTQKHRKLQVEKIWKPESIFPARSWHLHGHGMTRSQTPAFTLTALSLSTLMAALIGPVGAAPGLRMERADGSEISRKPCAIGWGEGRSSEGNRFNFVHTVENELANLSGVVPGSYQLATLYDDGSAQIWQATRSSDLNGIPPLSWVAAENVGSLALADSHSLALKRDGSLQVLRMGLSGPPPAGLGAVSAIAAGRDHLMALRMDGTVAAWSHVNANTYGQATVPAGLGGVVSIGAGDLHSVALKSDGTVVAWGATPQRQVPGGLNQVAQIAVGPKGTIALRTNGSLVSWGWSELTPPGNLGVVRQVAAGERYGAGIKADGTVAVWGWTQTDFLLPPPGLGEVTAIAAGDDQLVAITPRRIISFGDVGRSQQIQKSFTIRNSGDEVLNLSGIALNGIQGNEFTLDTGNTALLLPPGASTTFSIRFSPTALTTSAALLVVNSNDPSVPQFSFSVSGKGVNIPPEAPDFNVLVAEDTEWIDIDLPASDPNGDPITLSARLVGIYPKGGKLGPVVGNRVRFTPDRNFNGDVVINYQVYDSNLAQAEGYATVTVSPVNDAPHLSLPPPVIVRAGVASAGVPVSFNAGAGDIEDGHLAPLLRVGGQIVRSGDVFPPGVSVVEVTVTDAEGVTTTGSFEIRVIAGPCLAVQDAVGIPLPLSGKVVAWGSNGSGQTAVPPDLEDITAIAGGAQHSIALREDGIVVAWGGNTDGQASVPPDLAGVVAISTNGYFNLALKDDGSVRAWGGSSSGQTTIPAGLSDVTAISAGSEHALALRRNGSVVGWGSNLSGATNVPTGLPLATGIAAGYHESFARAGDGSIILWGGGFDSHREVDFPNWLSGVEAISSSAGHSLALRSDGSVVAWGEGSTGESTVPAGLGDVVSVGAGDHFSVAVRRDGSIATWGSQNAQLTPPAGLAGIAAVACGSSHVLALKDRKERATFRMPQAFGPVQRTLKVANSGTTPLEIDGISLVLGRVADFTIDTSGIPESLAPGQSAVLPVAFSPTGLGSRHATLRLVTNDPLGGSRDIELTGLWKNSTPVATNITGLNLAEDAPGGIQITLPATDANGNALSFAIVTPPTPSSGTLGPVTGNTVRFTPALDFNGAASFTFRANDGFADSNVATVSLTVSQEPDAPRLIMPPSPWVHQILSGQSAAVEFVAGARDPEEGWVNALVTRGGVPVASGAVFPLGDTVIDVTASDSTGATTTGSFIVRVQWGPDLVVEREGIGVLPKDRGVRAWGRNSSQQTSVPGSLTGVRAIAAGRDHSLALRSDGTVMAWGSNSSGQGSVPASLSGVVAIAAGAAHSVALKGDGTVVAWGSGFYGQSSVPAGLGEVTAICAGDHCTLALRSDGTVVGWGRNDYGQISMPAGLADVVAISAGGSHGLALKSDGTVVGWGSNLHGEANVPAGLSGVKRIAAGGGLHSLALRHDGSVVAWGRNDEGQATVPVGLTGIKEIAAGLYHSLALTLDREVVAWGRNNEGQSTVPLDPGRVEAISAGGYHSLALVPKALPVDFGTVHQGTETATTLTLRNQGPAGLDIGGLVLTSGDIADFALGAADLDEHLESGGSTTFTVKFSPTANGPRRAILTLRSNDTGHPALQLALSGHGRNGSPSAVAPGGVSVTEDTSAGVVVTLGASDPENDPLSYRIVSSPTVGGSLGTLSGNKVTFYPAFNFHGTASFTYLANDGGTDSSPAVVSITVTPVNDVPIMGSLPLIYRVTTPLAGGTPVHFRTPSIFDYEDGALAPLIRLNNGTVVGSGSVFPAGSTTVNVRGTDSGGLTVNGSFVINVTIVASPALQLESPAGSVVPRGPSVISLTRHGGISSEISPELRGVKEIAAGNDFGLALRHDGTLHGWGSNTVGQLSIPSGLSTATKIRCGSAFALALRSNGTVTAWGSNSSGQTAIPATLSTGVGDIAAGSFHAVACKADGTVAAWGNNSSGQCTVPAGLAGVSSVAAGSTHTLALKTDGTVIGWGSNNFGQCSIPAGLGGVLAIAAGGFHSLALKTDGTVVAWGRPIEGQTQVPPGLLGVTAISAGAYHSFALKSDGSVAVWGSYEPGSPVAALPAQMAPVAAIASASVHPVTAVDHPSTLNLGAGNTGGQIARTVTVRNRGSAGLNLAGITRTEGSGDFAVQTSALAGSVAAGQTTSFTVVFTPTSSGPQSARFRIASNDRYEAGFDLVVTGQGVPPFHAWAAAAGLGATGVDPEAIAHGDGVANLLKYAFNLNGAAPDSRRMIPGTGTAGLPSVTLEDGMLRIEFLRRKSGDLLYTATRSSSLATSSFIPMATEPTVTDIDATWERVVIREAVDPALTPQLFARVEVRMK